VPTASVPHNRGEARLEELINNNQLHRVAGLQMVSMRLETACAVTTDPDAQLA
jgi:hypothetical protein